MSDTRDPLPIDLPMDDLAAFCRRWNIVELALFGSVLRSDFGPQSDIDVLVTFAPASDPVPDREAMRRDLETLLGRRVDLLYRRVMERDSNYLLRKAILQSARVVYAA